MRVIVRLLIACVLAAPSLTTVRPDNAHPRSPELALATGTAHVSGCERPSPHQSGVCGVLTTHEYAPPQTGTDVLNALAAFQQSRTHHAARGRAPPQTALL